MSRGDQADQARQAAEVASIDDRANPDERGGALVDLLFAGLSHGYEGDDPPLNVFYAAKNDLRALETLLACASNASEETTAAELASAVQPLVLGIRRRLDVGIELYSRVFLRLEVRGRAAPPEAGAANDNREEPAS